MTNRKYYIDNKDMRLHRRNGIKLHRRDIEMFAWLTSAILLTAICFIMFSIFVYFTIHESIHAYDYEETVTYVVQQGDTLWTIARKYSSQRQDVRKVIELIEDINDCGAVIFPNDSIEVPLFTNMGRK